ncbi:alpha/beta fold hydrolase [Streptomyces dysideae]|uniref:alpha/beta fold hydrolase n=1 Tax=Streptomyces dysideae TaxID=909626 RepID=UPI000A4D6177|nr:alpha/beta fold hydrolase [Streptomyces dysideae]
MLCHGGPGLWDHLDDGRSERCAGPWTSERFVADLDAVRRHFGLERTVLPGHSCGAQPALSYAPAHPERVGGLVYGSCTGIGPVSDWYGPLRGAVPRPARGGARTARPLAGVAVRGT